MRRTPAAVCLLAALLAGCEAEPDPPGFSEVVDVVLYTTRCSPDVDPEAHFRVHPDRPFSIAWNVLCTRDDRPIQWFAVKVSFWEDRAEDAWNVWLIDPEVSEVRYGEATIEGTVDPNIVNEAHPLALERVAPILPLDEGDYRVEVWAILDEYLDSQRNEVRLTAFRD